MFGNKKPEFLFRCSECEAIFSVELEEEDLTKLHDDKLILQCVCEGKAYVLRD